VPFSRTEPNVPGFVEAAESPIDVSGVTSTTVSLTSNFDQVHILINTDATRGPRLKGLRVNGDTATNYDFRSTDGTETTNADSWELEGGVVGYPEFILTPRFSSVVVAASPATSASQLVSGFNGAVSGPVDQFTFFDDLLNKPFDLRARVFGLEV